MSKERPSSSDGFGFSENEKLLYRVRDKRMSQFLADERTRIHDIELSSNNYGEFLFVTLSRQDDPIQSCVTFFGLGFHESRDRWITDEWFWYRAHDSLAEKQIAREEATKRVDERRAEVTSYVRNAADQSERGKWFDVIADLTDDDAAQATIDDMGNFFDE